MKKKSTSIAQKLTPKVEIKLDGQAWPLVVTHNVLIEVEELTSMNILAGEANLVRPSAKLVRAILFTCLKRAGYKGTIDQVGELIGPHNILEIQKGILTAWAASMPEAESDTDSDPNEMTVGE